jgi:hypothetical protein
MLYQQTLGRAPDAAGKSWYLSRLNAGLTTPQSDGEGRDRESLWTLVVAGGRAESRKQRHDLVAARHRVGAAQPDQRASVGLLE